MVVFAQAQTGDATVKPKDKPSTVVATTTKAVEKPKTTTPNSPTASVHAPTDMRKGTTAANASISNMTILNSDKDDFSPTFYNNGILFCSNGQVAKKNPKDKADDKAPEDLNLKYAFFDSLGNLSKPKAFGKRANSKTNEGPSCFTPNGDTLYLTRTASKGGVEKLNKNGEITLKIYLKVRDTSGAFVGEEILPFESEGYSYCHPTLSPDGKRLYFASNMPGSVGGMDLWVSRRLKDGQWSQPINLGPRVNTAKNEIFPYMTEKGTLYFASNGLPNGKGGLDLFHIEIENKIARAYPMAEPFNTEGDDFGIMFLPKSDKKGYFSSNRPGGTGGDDIYQFEFK
jgi:hypothetical protein